MSTAQRTNPFTDIAMEAIAELEPLVDEVIAELSIPLGARIVPASTRRYRMQNTAVSLADMLFALTQEFGPEQVQELLGVVVPETGVTVLETIVQQYGDEVTRQAFGLLARQLKAALEIPGADRYLESAG